MSICCFFLKETVENKENMEKHVQKPCLKNASINTDIDTDLNFQLDVLTDRCIELEKSLIEEKSLSDNTVKI